MLRARPLICSDARRKERWNLFLLVLIHHSGKDSLLKSNNVGMRKKSKLLANFKNRMMALTDNKNIIMLVLMMAILIIMVERIMMFIMGNCPFPK